MFTDKRHSRQGVLSCVLGVCGIFALIYGVVQVFLNDGAVKNAQLWSLMLAAVYAAAGIALAVYALVRADTFRFFSVLGMTLNILVLTGLVGLFIWGLR